MCVNGLPNVVWGQLPEGEEIRLAQTIDETKITAGADLSSPLLAERIRCPQVVQLNVRSLPEPDSVETTIRSRFVGSSIILIANNSVVRAPKSMAGGQLRGIANLEKLCDSIPPSRPFLFFALLVRHRINRWQITI
jgi:hypothetical protein